MTHNGSVGSFTLFCSQSTTLLYVLHNFSVIFIVWITRKAFGLKRALRLSQQLPFACRATFKKDSYRKCVLPKRQRQTEVGAHWRLIFHNSHLCGPVPPEPASTSIDSYSSTPVLVSATVTHRYIQSNLRKWIPLKWIKQWNGYNFRLDTV